MVLRELLDSPVERAANFGNYLCILGVRNPRLGEPASALRTISRSWGETYYEAAALFHNSAD
jgi:hypothetical protein